MILCEERLPLSKHKKIIEPHSYAAAMTLTHFTRQLSLRFDERRLLPPLELRPAVRWQEQACFWDLVPFILVDTSFVYIVSL